MKRLVQNSIWLLACSAFLTGCATSTSRTASGTQNQVLNIRWQRLVDEKGQTCDRCGSTEKATEDGVKKLRRCLKPVGVEAVLEKTALSPATFAQDPLQSNRIWIADKPIEDWLQAKVGTSQCSGACGVSQCRTLTVDGTTYDTIPPELIVKAGLLAGAQMIGSPAQNPWNPTAAWSQQGPPCCPAPSGKPTK